MTTIDERIRKSFSQEDQAFLAELDAGDSLYREVAATFTGRMRWLNALAWVFGLVLMVAAAICAWQFVNEDDLRTMNLWGAGAALAFLGLAMIKLWFFMDMKSNAVLREIKRVEFQIASLNALVRASSSAAIGDTSTTGEANAR